MLSLNVSALLPGRVAFCVSSLFIALYVVKRDETLLTLKEKKLISKRGIFKFLNPINGIILPFSVSL